VAAAGHTDLVAGPSSHSGLSAILTSSPSNRIFDRRGTCGRLGSQHLDSVARVDIPDQRARNGTKAVSYWERQMVVGAVCDPRLPLGKGSADRGDSLLVDTLDLRAGRLPCYGQL
jgi:hypothetical protein